MYVAINSGVIFYPEIIKSPGGGGGILGALSIFFTWRPPETISVAYTDALDESTVTYIKKSFNISSDGKILIVHLLL